MGSLQLAKGAIIQHLPTVRNLKSQQMPKKGTGGTERDEKKSPLGRAGNTQ